MSRDQTAGRRNLILTTGLIFLVALWPRLSGLGGFLTTDERFWIESSRDFLGGLISRNFTCPPKTEHKGQAVLAEGRGWACTLRAGHPGVTTMWTGSLGLGLYYLWRAPDLSLVEFLATLPVKPVEPGLIPWVRGPTAVLAAAAMAGGYGLLRRFLARDDRSGELVALLAALLMALSPYELALSRILHTDALETIFLTLSVLALLNYWGAGGGRGWLVFSGVMAGLSYLSKSPALFLIPFAGLLALWRMGQLSAPAVSGRLKLLLRVATDLLGWAGLSGLTYLLLWPAWWVIPGEVFTYVFGVVFGYATALDDKGNFFLGQFVLDPGPWFYPVTWLFKTTPLAMIGLGLALLLRWSRARPAAAPSPASAPAWRRWLGYGSSQGVILFNASLLFALTFSLFLTFNSTKQVRYLLPVYPFLNILAALGWVWLLELRPSLWRWPRLKLFGLAGGLVATANLVLVISTFPYYFTYYNPLMGGIRVAERLMAVGWGEGLDQAAAYLNQKPEADRLTVAAWYGDSSFAPFFKGHTLDYFRQKGNVLAADYVVVYVYQRQRRLPDEGLYNFLARQGPPEHVIELNGVPYAWIYPGLGLDHHLEYERYPGVAELLGWEYTTPGLDPDRPLLRPGETLDFELWWEYLGKPPEETFFLWLVGQDGQIWAEALTQPETPLESESEWLEGEIIRETGRLGLPAGTPPGDYTVYLGFYPETATSPAEAMLFGLGDNPRRVSVRSGGESTPLPATLTRVEAGLENLRLIGFESDQAELKSGDSLQVDLYWQALADLAADYQVRLVLLDQDQAIRWASPPVELVSFYPTSAWRAGQVIRSQLSLELTPRTPGGAFQLGLEILKVGQVVSMQPLRSVSIDGRPRQFDLPAAVKPLKVEFAGNITLAGFWLAPDQPYRPGDPLSLDLFWQPRALVEPDYTVFVQLIGPDGQLYSQMDNQPQAGLAPTSSWTPGEVIQDTYHLTISSDTPPGRYRLITGLYFFETGERLRLTPGDQDFVELTWLDVK